MSLIINGISLAIAAIMAVSVWFAVPLTATFNMDNGFGSYIMKFGILLLLMVLYMVLHELVHGVAMKICGTKKVKYGFTGLYAFAGSDDYYYKGPYIFIALAPVIFWGVILAVVNAFVPDKWFWVVYIIQIINVSGAAGDLFVTIRFSRFPRDVLVKDHGVGMKVYKKSEN